MLRLTVKTFTYNLVTLLRASNLNTVRIYCKKVRNSRLFRNEGKKMRTPFYFNWYYWIGIIDIIYGTIMINACYTVLKFPCEKKENFVLMLGLMREPPMLVELKKSMLTLFSFKMWWHYGSPLFLSAWHVSCSLCSSPVILILFVLKKLVVGRS